MKPFTPDKLPIKNLNWISYISLIGDARDKLSKFDGLLQGIPNPTVLLSPLITQEAVISSKIEGTQATLEEVLEYEADPNQMEHKEDDIKEVLNYRKAMRYAVENIKSKSLSEKLIKEIHAILLNDVRSNTKIVGNYRSWQVFIGEQGTTIEKAHFVPPIASEVPTLMSNIEKYIHSKEIDPLVQLAIIHAQFEIIHPFGDGNGRLGRIIMPLFLFFKDVLSTPMFYLSAYFEEHRDEYYDKLNNISSKGDWDAWIIYFLKAVKEQSELNIKRAKSILNLYNTKKEEIKEATGSQYSINILDFIFSYPFFSTSQFSLVTKVKQSYSKDLIKKLEKKGIIKLLRTSTGSNPNIYFFPELLRITG
jgi:Fic family protein